MNEDKQMVIDYDLAREAINQLLDELDRLGESDPAWAENQKSIIRNSLDDCFELAVKAKPLTAALAKAEERVRELEFALKNLSDECMIIAEALNDYPPCTQPSMSRNEASRNLKQWVSDIRTALEGK
ncbi:MAG: hypothetical protein IT205_03090 [Fimbriimonadaceae bacterium]|nr:hypothetical protein [Fimbriimonadaceae bacterium]